MSTEPTMIYTPTREHGVFTTTTLLHLLRPHALTCDVRMSVNKHGMVTEIRAYCPKDQHIEEEEA